MTSEVLNAFRGDILSETTITGDYQLRESRVRNDTPSRTMSAGLRRTLSPCYRQTSPHFSFHDISLLASTKNSTPSTIRTARLNTELAVLP